MNFCCISGTHTTPEASWTCHDGYCTGKGLLVQQSQDTVLLCHIIGVWSSLMAQLQSLGSFPVHGKPSAAFVVQLHTGFGISGEPRLQDLHCLAECAHLRDIKHTSNLPIYITLNIYCTALYILTNQLEN